MISIYETPENKKPVSCKSCGSTRNLKDINIYNNSFYKTGLVDNVLVTLCDKCRRDLKEKLTSGEVYYGTIRRNAM